MADQSHDDMECSNDTDFASLLNDSQMDSNIDIDKILNDKAQKNQLTKTNVKNLIRNVLMNDDVATMLRQTLNDDKDANCLYEPKLTRAKIREMLKDYPPSVQQWSPFQQQSIISECRQLIEKEFNDDSEDEEYCPDKSLEGEDFDDDDDSKCTEINKSFDEIEVENSLDSSKSKFAVDSNDKDTIGMRTRSKYSLNDTPLEVIEQAFIPPDITEDMYDSACENDEWMEFLSEFTKPLESVQNDDQEDDPEYNVLCDDDFTNVDKEEFRIDRSVKISRKEYNALMNELYDFTESYLEFNGPQEPEITENYKNENVAKSKISSNSIPVYTSNCSDWKSNSDEHEQTTEIASCSIQTKTTHQENIVHPNIYEQLKNMASIISTQKFIQSNNEPCEAFDKKVENVGYTTLSDFVIHQKHGLTSKQLILLKYQLTQHIQLVTQSYLLCTMVDNFKSQIRKLKTMLKYFATDNWKNKNYSPINLLTSLKFIEDWNEGQLNKSDTNKDYVLLPSYVKEFILFYNVPVFIYPNLLPVRTYRLHPITCPIGKSEESVLALKIEAVYNKLKRNCSTRSINKTKSLSDLMPIILKTVHERWFSYRKLSDLKTYITRRRNSSQPSILKNYLVHGKIENIKHVIDVDELFKGKCLYEYSINNFPSSWKPLVTQLTRKT